MQFWDAAAATIALDRVLILPQFVCYCDEGWLSGQCERAGVVNQSLPFNCPPDYVVNLLNMDDDPLHFGVSLKWRESTFLSHSKTPVATKVQHFAMHHTFHTLLLCAYMNVLSTMIVLLSVLQALKKSILQQAFDSTVIVL